MIISNCYTLEVMNSEVDLYFLLIPDNRSDNRILWKLITWGKRGRRVLLARNDYINNRYLVSKSVLYCLI